jgi:aryl-alcohol dehydrogenase-like predicted oxidoreductase
VANPDQIRAIVTTALPIASSSLGADGSSIPRVALGCGNFGGIGSSPEWFGHGLDDDAAATLMDAAWELGITHFDTADAYGGGRSESAIGRWIESRGVRPKLTTKTFNPMTAGGDSGLAPERIERQLRLSLERLQVESLDLYLAHDYDPVVPLADTMATFAALRAAGRISAYGVSNFNAGQLEQALAAGAPVAVQNGYSLLERGDEAQVLPQCRARGLAYLVYSPLRGGWLTGKYRRGSPYPPGSRMTQRPGPYEALANDRTFAALDALEAFAIARSMSMAAVALAWLLADDRVSQVVVGPGRAEHLDFVREAIDRPLAPAEYDRLAEMFG